MSRSNFIPPNVNSIATSETEYKTLQEFIALIIHRATNEYLELPTGFTNPVIPYMIDMLEYMTAFIKLTLEDKKRLEPSFSPNGFDIHGISPESPYKRITIYFANLQIMNEVRQTPLIKLTKKDESKEYYVACGNFRELLKKHCTSHPNLKDIEFFVPKRYARNFPVLNETHWNNNWDNTLLRLMSHKGNQITSITPCMLYDKVLDNIVIKHFTDHIKTLNTANTLTILDVGGGKGRLAKKIIEAVNATAHSIHYILLEPSLAQITEAKKLLQTTTQIRYRISFLNMKLEQLKACEPIHYLISSGGPFNAEVVNREQAKTNLRKLQSLMTNNGTMIMLGLSPLLIRSKDLNEAGFTCLSYKTNDSLLSEVKDTEQLKSMKEAVLTLGNVQCYISKKNPVPALRAQASREYFQKLQGIVKQKSYFATQSFWESKTMKKDLEELENTSTSRLKIWMPY